MPEYSKREQRGWCFYDWANSAYFTTVVTLFLGPYLTSVAKHAADARGFIYPLGIPVAAASLWPYMVSLSVLIQVVLLPVVGAVADYGRRKRELLGALALTGAGATVAMYLIEGGRYALGSALFLVANSAFGASIVVYNSFLPEIAPAEQRDRLSSIGWGLGYLGGGLMLAMNLLLYANAAKLGITEGVAVRLSLAAAGLWWALFTLIPLATLENRKPQKQLAEGVGYLGAALRQLRQTLGEIRSLPHTVRFLVAYLLYNDGIQTVLTLAAQFGQEELRLPVGSLTVAILIAQFVGVGGAALFNWMATRIGSQRTVMATLVIYCLVLAYAYGPLSSQLEFYCMAGAIGAVMGGSQALSRSLFSFMIPKGHEAEYYSVYEISDKGTSWLGPLLFGLALQFTKSYRVAILSLILFFVAGLALLARVDVRRAAEEAGNQPPA